MSKSQTRQTSTQSTSSTVSNLNVQDTEGVTLVNSGGNTLTLTDFGAIEAGRQVADRALSSAVDIGTDALLLGRDSLREGADLAGRGLDNASEALRGSFAFGETAIGSNERTTDAALAFGTRAIDSIANVTGEGFAFARATNADSLDAIGGVARDALAGVSDSAFNAVKAVGDAQVGILDFARDIFQGAIGANRDVVESNLTGLGSLAKQTSASADDRVTKVAGYALLAVVAVLAGPSVFAMLKKG